MKLLDRRPLPRVRGAAVECIKHTRAMIVRNKLVSGGVGETTSSAAARPEAAVDGGGGRSERVAQSVPSPSLLRSADSDPADRAVTQMIIRTKRTKSTNEYELATHRERTTAHNAPPSEMQQQQNSSSNSSEC